MPAAASKRGLTVAVTGPTGDIGRSFLRALERSREVERVVAMARRYRDCDYLVEAQRLCEGTEARCNLIKRRLVESRSASD